MHKTLQPYALIGLNMKFYHLIWKNKNLITIVTYANK